MASGERAARRYLRAVRRLLPCSRGMKNEIMAPLRSSVGDYLERHPQADMDQIKAQFGEPMNVAVACLDNLDKAALLKRYHIRPKILAATAAALAAALMLWVGGLIYSCIELYNVYGALATRTYVDPRSDQVLYGEGESDGER